MDPTFQGERRHSSHLLRLYDDLPTSLSRGASSKENASRSLSVIYQSTGKRLYEHRPLWPAARKLCDLNTRETYLNFSARELMSPRSGITLLDTCKQASISITWTNEKRLLNNDEVQTHTEWRRRTD